MLINKRSDYLTVLVATYNRLDLLKLTLDSIAKQTVCGHEVIVIDGGSTDGTIDYLKARTDITSIFQGELLGTARSYNRVWEHIVSKYTCWLSDDTEIANGGLDLAVKILEGDSDIGMVGLKMKEVSGRFAHIPYGGALSEYGILNCNHGVLSMNLLRSLSYFNEAYRSYTIDPDLTASVLCAGKKVVLTKSNGVLHHRDWADDNWQDKVKKDLGGIDNNAIYHEKFRFLGNAKINAIRAKISFSFDRPEYYDRIARFGINSRDWHNLLSGRFIRIFDPVGHINKPYYLEQKVPYDLLINEENPYKHLLDRKQE